MPGLKSFAKAVGAKLDPKTAHYKYFNSVVIVAAGNGSRMGAGHRSKQLCEVAGLPVVVRSVNAFEECGFIDEIIIVAKNDELGEYDGFIKNYGWKKVVKVVAGGSSRSESVLNGFKCISDESDYVFIHDAARCLVTPEMIEAVARDVCKYGAACAAEKARDSVKNSADGFITGNIERDGLWYAQTPQAFRTDLYRAAAYTGADSRVTDDCTLVENIGFKIYLTDCGGENIKLTYPVDFAVAEAILKFRESREVKENE